jgi:hypothetical protein
MMGSLRVAETRAAFAIFVTCFPGMRIELICINRLDPSGP